MAGIVGVCESVCVLCVGDCMVMEFGWDGGGVAAGSCTLQSDMET